jgi:hypothetical protein
MGAIKTSVLPQSVASVEIREVHRNSLSLRRADIRDTRDGTNKTFVHE